MLTTRRHLIIMLSPNCRIPRHLCPEAPYPSPYGITVLAEASPWILDMPCLRYRRTTPSPRVRSNPMCPPPVVALTTRCPHPHPPISQVLHGTVSRIDHVSVRTRPINCVAHLRAYQDPWNRPGGCSRHGSSLACPQAVASGDPAPRPPYKVR